MGIWVQHTCSCTVSMWFQDPPPQTPAHVVPSTYIQYQLYTTRHHLYNNYHIVNRIVNLFRPDVKPTVNLHNCREFMTQNLNFEP